MPNTARTGNETSRPAISINTTLYDFIDLVSGDFDAEDRLVEAVVSHMMATGQLRLVGDRRSWRRMLREL